MCELGNALSFLCQACKFSLCQESVWGTQHTQKLRITEDGKLIERLKSIHSCTSMNLVNMSCENMYMV
jgi:hypothetical protein